MNILGFNIGQNYKGILNLGSTINTPLSATLQSVTDGMGNASPLQLSTTQVAIGIGALTNGVLSIKTTQANTNGTIAFLNNGAATIAAITDSGSALTPMIFRATEYRFTDATGLVIGRGYTDSASARLHVRGDGTNPIARFENSAGANFLTINNLGQTIFGNAGANEPYLVNYNGTATESGTGQSLRIRQRANTGTTGNTLIQYWADGLFSGTTSGTAISHEFLSSGFAGAAGNANYRNTTFAYTINNSGAQTGTATGIFLNATETALNGMGHNLLDLQVGGVSRFRVSNIGVLTTEFGVTGNNASAAFQINGRWALSGTALGTMLFQPWSGSTLIMQWGGTTNAFPALKRNGAALEVRLADDSAPCPITASTFTQTAGDFSTIISGTNFSITTSGGTIGYNGVSRFNNSLEVGTGGTSASAILQANSTTRGFLPPRMTTTQVNAIATPAEGLVVFNTTISHLCVYQSGAWVKLSHSPM